MIHARETITIAHNIYTRKAKIETIWVR